MAYTQADWATQVLTDAGLPTTQNNVNNVVRWMVAEEPPSNWWNRNNPLNASLGTSAADGTGSYTDLSTGALYTAKMIRQSNMSGIFNALNANADVSAFSAAVVASPWASGHYGGNPNAIANIPVPTFTSANVAPGSAGGAGSAGGGSGFNPNAPALSFPLLGTVVNQGQELKIKGWALMIAGGFVAVVGLGVVLATLGLQSKAGRTAAEVVPGGVAAKTLAGAGTTTQRSRRIATEQRAEQRQADRMQLAQERGSQQRATDASRQTRSIQGAPRRALPPAGSRERRERAAQPF